MARTTLTKYTLAGGYDVSGVDFTWVAADFTSGNQFTSTGREVLLVKADGGAAVVTVTSVADPLGRTGDVDSFSVSSGYWRAFGPYKQAGWMQASDGMIYVDGADANVKLCVIVVPSAAF
jgi:hypothetical protein